MGVKHHEGVDTQCATSSVNFMMTIDGCLARAFLGAVQLAQIHRRYVRDFGRK